MTESFRWNPVPISVVVPVYNSEGSLPMLIARLEAVLRTLGCSYELILVDDGSRDESWMVIRDLAAKSSAIHGISLMRNYGQHNALLCGIRAAQFGVIVTMDDDLQHPPEEIPKLLDKLEEGYDVVYGTAEREQHGLWRDLASRLTKLALQTTMGADIACNVSAFRAFRTELREAFANFQTPFVSIDVLLTWGTTRFAAHPVHHEPRRVGASNYTLGKLLAHALTMMTGFSAVPLRLASIIGFVFTLFGLGVLVYVVGRYLVEGGTVPGFPFLASIVAIFSGAQLFAIGIIGEYLARLHFRMMDWPTYAVRQKVVSGQRSE